jgi:5-hydroxyisourate hydrolase
MSAITTHVLDLAAGAPAAGVAVRLERREGGGWTLLGEGRTDADGRLRTLLPEGRAAEPGVHRLTFALEEYFAARGIESFHPEAVVTFRVRSAGAHLHVPLLAAPFGYSTYRGS